MVDLYYMLGILIIISEVRSIIYAKTLLEVAGTMNTKIENASKEDIKSKKVKLSKAENDILITNILYILWIGLGIMFCTEWAFFVAIIGLSLIPKDKLGTWWMVVDAILSIFIIGFIIANHFLLHWI